MKIKTKHFRVDEGEDVDLDKWPTRVDPVYDSKDDYKTMLAEHVDRLAELQDVLYADNRYALLVIFQAMDAAGKDGAIKHVMSGVNPQGCRVYSFKHPSAEELDHDFLWRSARVLPERGNIGIFNRSYYEEVLILRVHPALLRAEGVPDGQGETLWEGRYRSIVEMEKHLHRNGTRIVKFFLHLSKKEQTRRFLARIDDPAKNWKFNEGDIEERGYWKKYMRAYEKCLTATSSKQAPWYVVPADDKQNARLIVSKVILETLEDLGLAYPTTSDEHRAALAKIREQLVSGEA
ncbi:MAG: polyphosphate kinase 2 family protein [Hyphomicrobiales bacterium]|nr:polyphosphate kinase 2 family protein [Hyphomicrobiales bacterium]